MSNFIFASTCSSMYVVEYRRCRHGAWRRNGLSNKLSAAATLSSCRYMVTRSTNTATWSSAFRSMVIKKLSARNQNCSVLWGRCWSHAVYPSLWYVDAMSNLHDSELDPISNCKASPRRVPDSVRNLSSLSASHSFHLVDSASESHAPGRAPLVVNASW